MVGTSAQDRGMAGPGPMDLLAWSPSAGFFLCIVCICMYVHVRTTFGVWSCPADINFVQRGELAVDTEGLPPTTQQQQQQNSSSSSGAAAAARPPGAVYTVTVLGNLAYT